MLLTGVFTEWAVAIRGCVAVFCSVLQCDAVCCSVLQCAAVCCSVLQCVAVCYWLVSLLNESLPSAGVL